MEENINVDIKEFINEFLIKSIGKLVDAEFHYYSFIIIGQGIEFLGSLFDDQPFDKHIPDGYRFKNALSKNLFPNSFYKQNQDWLYNNFRCSLIHQIRPSEELLLTSNSINKYPEEKHLKKLEGSDKRVIIIELLYRDFKKACEKVIKMIERKDSQLDQAKIVENYLNIFSVDLNGVKYEVTGSTYTSLSVYKN